MPRYSANHVPSYRLHKQSGQAIVTIGRRDYLLGRHGTPASREAYNRHIAAWFASNKSSLAVSAHRDTADSADAINAEQVNRNGRRVPATPTPRTPGLWPGPVTRLFPQHAT